MRNHKERKLKTMTINIPYELGDYVQLDDSLFKILGIHIYVDQNGIINRYRFHVGPANFIIIPKNSVVNTVDTVIHGKPTKLHIVSYPTADVNNSLIDS